MDVRLERAERQLTNFLDDELSSSRVGLGEGARAHLDRFRSILNAFYVAQFGYWPPQANDRGNRSSFSKQTYHAMYVDFRSLYEYLVDQESTTSIERNKPPNGGLCVLQNVLAFDERNGYASLEHPLPLLPETEVMSNALPTEQQRRPFSVMRSLGRSLGKTSKFDKRMAILDALSAASNTDNPSTTACPLVQAYMDFEEEVTLKQEEKVSAVDARKVRWILVYAILQTLISVTRVPPEVRDAGGDVSYHLCCRTSGTPPWMASAGSKQSATTQDSPAIETPEVSSHPNDISVVDFRPDNADLIARRISAHSSLTSSPIGSSTHLSSLIHGSHHHNNTEPQHTLQSQPLQPSTTNPNTPTPSTRRTGRFCEILVWGYGNGLNAAAVAVSSSTSSPSPSNNHNHNYTNQTKPQDHEQDHEQDPDHLSLPTLSALPTPSPSSPSPTPSPSSHACPSRSPSPSSSSAASAPAGSSTSTSVAAAENDGDKEKESNTHIEGGCSRSTSSATATTSTTEISSASYPTMDHLSVTLEGTRLGEGGGGGGGRGSTEICTCGASKQ